MQTPSVGRALWYFPDGHGSEPPLAAIISRVWSDDCVNIAVFGANGRPDLSPPTSVVLLQGDTPTPNNRCYCKWPTIDKPPPIVLDSHGDVASPDH